MSTFQLIRCMPELPEVETIKRELSRKIKNKKFNKVEVRVVKMVNLSNKEFKKQIIGQKIKDIKRRAKILIFELTKNLFLVVHLKLTGQLIYRAKGGKLSGGGHPIKAGLENLPNKFTHIIYTFSDGSRLFYNDLRKFGWHKLVTKKQLDKILLKFGPEPLDLNFNLTEIKRILFKRPKKKVKQLLLDQSLIAGIGNIYSDEACFYAKIHPFRPAGKLKDSEIKNLLRGIKNILTLAVAKQGTSVDQYVDAFGRQGNFVSFLKVYSREGEPCKRCRTKIKRLKLGSRSTHFCPKCQK